jgi:hypothetical protein
LEGRPFIITGAEKLLNDFRKTVFSFLCMHVHTRVISYAGICRSNYIRMYKYRKQINNICIS